MERSARGAAKIREEADEIEAALAEAEATRPTRATRRKSAICCSPRLTLRAILRADPEALLRQTNRKFERRFASIERALAARGKAPQDATLAEMDALWDEAKAAEQSPPPCGEG